MVACRETQFRRDTESSIPGSAGSSKRSCALLGLASAPETSKSNLSDALPVTNSCLLQTGQTSQQCHSLWAYWELFLFNPLQNSAVILNHWLKTTASYRRSLTNHWPQAYFCHCFQYWLKCQTCIWNAYGKCIILHSQEDLLCQSSEDGIAV